MQGTLRITGSQEGCEIQGLHGLVGLPRYDHDGDGPRKLSFDYISVPLLERIDRLAIANFDLAILGKNVMPVAWSEIHPDKPEILRIDLVSHVKEPAKVKGRQPFWAVYEVTFDGQGKAGRQHGSSN